MASHPLPRSNWPLIQNQSGIWEIWLHSATKVCNAVWSLTPTIDTFLVLRSRSGLVPWLGFLTAAELFPSGFFPSYSQFFHSCTVSDRSPHIDSSWPFLPQCEQDSPFFLLTFMFLSCSFLLGELPFPQLLNQPATWQQNCVQIFFPFSYPLCPLLPSQEYWGRI